MWKEHGGSQAKNKKAEKKNWTMTKTKQRFSYPIL